MLLSFQYFLQREFWCNLDQSHHQSWTLHVNGDGDDGHWNRIDHLQEKAKKLLPLLSSGLEKKGIPVCPLGKQLLHFECLGLLLVKCSFSKPIKPQHSHTNSPNWSLYISMKNKLREFDKRSKHFPSSDYFFNSHNLFSWLCIGIIRRKLSKQFHMWMTCLAPCP